MIHEQLSPSLAVCAGPPADGSGLVMTADTSAVTCPDCRKIRATMERRMARILPGIPTPTSVAASVSGGSGMSWTDPAYSEATDWPAVEEKIGADRLDPEIMGQIGMIETIDEHLTTTVERVDELSEQLRDLKEALEDAQKAAEAPAEPVAPAAPPTVPVPSSDLREDILAVLEEFGHDPEVATEILVELVASMASDAPPAPAALPERFPTIVKATADHMTTEDLLLVREAIERGDSEVTPEGHLRVTYHDGEPLEWIFTEDGWRWSDARTAEHEVDVEALAEEMWRANLETMGTGYVALDVVSESMQGRYRDMAKQITTIMQDPDRTFLR